MVYLQGSKQSYLYFIKNVFFKRSVYLGDMKVDLFSWTCQVFIIVPISYSFTIYSDRENACIDSKCGCEIGITAV